MSLDISKIKALCFDVDGTLSDTDDLYVQKIRDFFPRILFKDPDHSARRFIMWIEAPGNALLGLADTLHLDDEMVAVINWISRRKKHSSKKFLLVPGVDSMLKQLHGRYPMSVVSARDERGTMAFLEQYNLAQYFDAVVTGLSAKHTKPYPDPVLLAAQKMKVPPENCLMIGDTTVDMRAGKSAGAQTVGVLCGFGEEPELEKMGADLILEDTTKLLDILKPYHSIEI
ncbi:MAG: HAD family hydrolase [Anaerolineales bacterium]|nr:HAD family hydrolase [Anaerolineales bacterium]